MPIPSTPATSLDQIQLAIVHLQQEIESISASAPTPAPAQQRPESRVLRKAKVSTAVVLSLTLPAFLLIAFLLIAFAILSWHRRKWRQQPRTSHMEISQTTRNYIATSVRSGLITPQALRLWQPYDVIARLVRNFDGSLLIGGGSFGHVYRSGNLPGQGGEVAVKRIIPVQDANNISEFSRTFFAEVNTISRVPEHGNLLKLVAWCFEGAGDALLVYKFLERGDIGKYLHGDNARKAIIADADVRMRMVLGVAKGLLHLHDNRVLHRDVKPENVLLTDDMEAVLCDFGFMRPLISSSGHRLSTGPTGTLGFCAPEISENEIRHPTRETDVYSFGVLLLVVASGKRPQLPAGNNSTVHLAHRIRQQLNSQPQIPLLHHLDPDLRITEETRDRVERQWTAVLNLGLWCTEGDPGLRPSMREVVELLTHLA